MQKQLDEMLQKRMDRKEFLKHVAMGVAVITGAAGIIKLVKPGAAPGQQATTDAAYGSAAYGGTPRKPNPAA